MPCSITQFSQVEDFSADFIGLVLGGGIITFNTDGNAVLGNFEDPASKRAKEGWAFYVLHSGHTLNAKGAVVF